MPIKGMYDTSLVNDVKVKHSLRKASIVHIDCDLYTSTKKALEFVENLVVPGTILIFDDWYCFRNKGENLEEYGEVKAFNEWNLKQKFMEFYDISGRSKAFIMTN